MSIKPVTLPELLLVPVGIYHITTSEKFLWFFTREIDQGWVDVRVDESGERSFLWTSNKDYHWRFGNEPAKSITINTNGRVVCYMESAISMWIKWGYGKGSEEELKRANHFAQWLAYHLTKKDKDDTGKYEDN